MAVKATVHKITLMVVDHENLKADDIVDLLESCRWVYPRVTSIETAEVDWRDDHPLNRRETRDATLAEIFPTTK